MYICWIKKQKMRFISFLIGLTLFIFNIYVIIKVSLGLYYNFRYPDNYPLDQIKWYIYYMITEIWLITNIAKFVTIDIKKIDSNHDDSTHFEVY